MGFFSQDCEACGHPLLSSAATDPINRWMTESVAITPDGKVIIGDYDGYGSVMAYNVECDHNTGDEDDATPCGCADIDEDSGEPTFSYESGVTTWHQACWRIAGSPTDNRGDSRSSADQGWFFGDDDHAVAEPKTFADVCAARIKADAPIKPVDEDAAMAKFIAEQAKLGGLQK